MKLDPKLLLASMGISAGIVLFVMGMNTGLTGRDATNLPDAIENISPGQGERVLRQSQVIIDFVDGYEATMFIDGIELPTTRIEELITSGEAPAPGAQFDFAPNAIYEPGNFTISYLPQDGAPIEELKQGEHTGKVKFWLINQGENKARVYTWKFKTGKERDKESLQNDYAFFLKARTLD
jgi:hypothetical protein